MPPRSPKRDRVDDDEPPVLASSRPTTRARTKPARDAKKAAELAEVEAEREALEARRRATLAARPVAPPGNRGDGRLHIAHVRVGQGDCTIMATPAGQILMFDCGSDATDGESGPARMLRVRSVLNGVKFLRGYSKVDVLVLTHSDTDHYNLLRKALTNTVTIGSVYYSGSALSNYSQAQTSAFIKAQISHPTQLKKVTHNADPAHGAPGTTTINDKLVPPAGGGVVIDRLDAAGGITIVSEAACTATILAANVTHLYTEDNSNPTNRGSVVTLVQANGQSVLICGDATFNTEQYLLNTAAPRITNMSIAQAGHHGSRLTSSQQAFVNTVNPGQAVISAPKNVPLHHLPSEEVIDRYRARLTASGRAAVGEHETWFWRAGGLGSYTSTSIFHTEQVYTTGSYDTIEFTL